MSSPRSAFRVPRSAFTLAEMVVSVGVLVLVLLTAGQVFTITLSSTGKARGLTEVNQALRSMEDSLRAELAAVSRNKSLMVIQANSVNAHWTTKHKETDSTPLSAAGGGYAYEADPEREDLAAPGQLILPRADILAFVTHSPEQSFAGSSSGQSSNTQWIVYGHAEIGDLDPTAAPGAPAWSLVPEAFPAFPQVGTYFPNTADTWHLARRSVLIVPTLDINTTTPFFADDLTDVDAIPPTNTPPAPSGALQCGFADTVSTATLTNGFLYSDNFAAYNDGVSGSNPWELDQPTTPVDLSWFKRSHLDPSPPPAFAQMLGHYLLPNCCSFKVEWTFDVRAARPELASEPEIYWFDPGNPTDTLGRINAVIADPLTTAARSNALMALRDNNGSFAYPNYLAQRFGITAEVAGALDSTGTAMSPAPVAGQPTWYDLDPFNPTSGDPDPYFPTALKITVDVMDAQGRFDRPLRHVMILPVGAD